MNKKTNRINNMISKNNEKVSRNQLKVNIGTNWKD